MQPGDRSMIPVRQTRYWRPTRSPLTRMTQSDAKPNRLTKYRSEPTTTRSNTAPDRASAGTSRSRDKARANNSAADLVTVMVRSLADPSNGPPGAGPRQINHPRRLASTKGSAPAVLRHYAFHGCQMTDHTPETTRSVCHPRPPGRSLLTYRRLFAPATRASATVCNRRGAGGAATSSPHRAGEQPQANARREPGVEDVLTVGSAHAAVTARTKGVLVAIIAASASRPISPDGHRNCWA